MQQSVSSKPEKTDELVRRGPDVVFHRDVFLQVVPPDAPPGLPLDFDDDWCRARVIDSHPPNGRQPWRVGICGERNRPQNFSRF